MGVTPGQMCCGQVLTLLRSVQAIAGLGETECPCLKYRVDVLSLDERFGGVWTVWNSFHFGGRDLPGGAWGTQLSGPQTGSWMCDLLKPFSTLDTVFYICKMRTKCLSLLGLNEDQDVEAGCSSVEHVCSRQHRALVPCSV